MLLVAGITEDSFGEGQLLAGGESATCQSCVNASGVHMRVATESFNATAHQLCYAGGAAKCTVAEFWNFTKYGSGRGSSSAETASAGCFQCGTGALGPAFWKQSGLDEKMRTFVSTCANTSCGAGGCKCSYEDTHAMKAWNWRDELPEDNPMHKDTSSEDTHWQAGPNCLSCMFSAGEGEGEACYSCAPGTAGCGCTGTMGALFGEDDNDKTGISGGCWQCLEGRDDDEAGAACFVNTSCGAGGCKCSYEDTHAMQVLYF